MISDLQKWQKSKKFLGKQIAIIFATKRVDGVHLDKEVDFLRRRRNIPTKILSGTETGIQIILKEKVKFKHFS